MHDPATQVYVASQSCRSAGEIMGGLAALKTIADELFVILDNETIRLPARQVRIDDVGIHAGDRLIAPLDRLSPWTEGHGGPCVHFGNDDERGGVIAPAVRLEGMDVAKIVERFFERCDSDEDVFLYGIERNIPQREGFAGPRLAMRAGSGGGDAFSDEDSLMVRGHDILLGDIIWAEAEADGDGNRYLHLVLGSGQYRRICVGDFSR